MIKEQDLFLPLREFFVSRGYKVNAEVGNIDMTAMADGHLIIIEMKRQFNMKLLEQGMDRKSIADAVFLAIERPSRFSTRGSWRLKLAILKKLGLGLLFVSPSNNSSVDVIIEADVTAARGSKRRTRILNEIGARIYECNVGGITRTKIMTAYKLNALKIASLLSEHGQLSPRALRELGSDPAKTTTILYRNVYGWFVNVDRALYRISPAGLKALEEFKHIISNL